MAGFAPVPVRSLGMKLAPFEVNEDEVQAGRHFG